MTQRSFSVRHDIEYPGWTVDATTGERVITFRGGFNPWPPSGSLRDVFRTTLSPEMGEWDLILDRETTAEWTPGCQGIAFHGDHVFVTQNSKGVLTDKARKGIYKLDTDWNIVEKTVKARGSDNFSFHGGSHWGDLDVDRDTVYVALENGNRVVEMDPDSLSVRSSTQLGSRWPDSSSDGDPHSGGSNPWCAINPWNGLLYTSNYEDVEAVHAYDPGDEYRHVAGATIPLDRVEGERLQGIQGGAFSPNGHLYLSSFTKSGDQTHGWEDSPDETDWLFAFNALTGGYLDRREITAKAGGTRGQELEGMTIEQNDFGGQGEAAVHVVLLDREFGPTRTNSVYYKAFRLPAGATL